MTAPALMPPYLVLSDFLDEDTVDRLLAFALHNEAAFAPTSLGRGTIDEARRISASIHDLGPFKPLLKARMLALLPEFVTSLHATPLPDTTLEIELVAHGDGAFYKRHVDTQTATDFRAIRFLSGVYYFHTEPKAFSGGALRLYAIGPQAAHVDIEPVRNSLVVFPSWIPHEVLRVSCPSRRFAGSRFAINCWFLGTRPS
jgi:Rps23 Pro-64 3,4-dihydroxylase Tpa1-like proline 4-hydroxylase